MFTIKKTVCTALFVAIGVVLPLTLHAVPNAGSVLLPMHIPVFVCGILCGFPYGLLCGIATPFLSSLLLGMPPFAYLPAMLGELAAYGLVSSWLMRTVRMKNRSVQIYVALAGAMLSGRIVYGLLNALIFRMGSYSVEIWLTSAFVTALPGVVIQLILVPGLVMLLEKSGLVEAYR